MDAISLGKYLQQARIDARWPDVLVARKLGIHYTELRAYEAGTKDITLRLLLGLCDIYGLDALKTGFLGDFNANGYEPTLPEPNKPQIEFRPYKLSTHQKRYLQYLHQGRRGFGRLLMADEYMELVKCELVENEALTAHGEWYVEEML